MAVVIAIDAGTTGVRAIAFDHGGQVVGSSYREFTQHFPQPGLGRARRRRDLGGGAGHPGRAGGRASTSRWPPSASPTSARPPWCGTAAPGGRCTGPSCGRTGAPRPAATSCATPATSTWCGAPPGWCSTRTSRPPSWSGCSPRAASSPRADLAFGTDRRVAAVEPHRRHGRRPARCTPPTCPTPAAPCCSTSAPWPGPTELCDLFGVPLSHAARGAARRAGASASPPPAWPASAAGVPVSGIAGDQQAALFGQACFEPGMTKNTYGTGLVRADERRARPAPSRSRACSPPSPGPCPARGPRTGRSPTTVTHYALEGAIFVTGAAVQWLRDGLGIIAEAAEIGPLAESIARHRGRGAGAGLHRARQPVVGPLRPGHAGSASPGAPAGPTWPGPWSRPWPSRPATWSTP